MPNFNDRGLTDIKPYSLQQIFNQSFDREAQVLVIEGVGFDGQNVQKLNADNLALKITVAGSITYIAKSAPGSLEADAVWQCKKIDETTGTVVTWADGDSNYNNVASDLTALTYS